MNRSIWQHTYDRDLRALYSILTRTIEPFVRVPCYSYSRFCDLVYAQSSGHIDLDVLDTDGLLDGSRDSGNRRGRKGNRT
jgi:hypothetical protein